MQRESSANIKEPPKPYIHSSPPQKVNIIEFDCRGLELTEFRADVGENHRLLVGVRWLTRLRGSGRQTGSSLLHCSRASICRKASGSTTMRKRARR